MKSIVRACKWLLPGCVAVGLIARAIGQVYQVQTNVTDSQGKVVATGTIQFATTVPSTGSGPATNPAPVSPPPTTNPAPAAPPIALATTLPVFPGQSYESDRWLATFQRDANGFLIPPVFPANACVISTAATPGHLASDYSDFLSAQAAAFKNGSYCILFRDGGIYTNAQDPKQMGTATKGLGAIDDNIQIPGGTVQHPVIISRVGVGGYNDRSAAPPKLLGGFVIGGSKYGGPAANYLEVFGLTFYGDHRDPGSATYNKNDATNGWYQDFAFRFRQLDLGTSQSDHFLFSDVRASYIGGAFDFEGNAANTLNTVILDHCEVDHNYGEKFGGYAQEVTDLLLNYGCFAYNGWNQQVAPKADPTGRYHDWYSQGVTPPAPADMGHRYINCVFATAQAEGLKDYSGGLIDTCLFLADPIAGCPGEFPVLVNNCVVDGDNAEFDAAEGGQAGYALALTADNSAPRGWGFDLSGSPNATVQNSLFVDKQDSLNNGDPIYIEGDITFNITGEPDFKSGTTNLTNLIVHNWTMQDKAGVGYQDNPPAPPYTATNCDFSGTGNYVNAGATITTYAQSLGVAGIKDGPTWLNAAIQNSSTNWNPALTAPAFCAYMQANFKAKGN